MLCRWIPADELSTLGRYYGKFATQTERRPSAPFRHLRCQLPPGGRGSATLGSFSCTCCWNRCQAPVSFLFHLSGGFYAVGSLIRLSRRAFLHRRFFLQFRHPAVKICACTSRVTACCAVRSASKLGWGGKLPAFKPPFWFVFRGSEKWTLEV